MTAASSKTPAGYARNVDTARRKEFAALRSWVRSVLPAADETLQYRMPTFEDARTGRAICAIAAQKRYLALYVCVHTALDPKRDAFSELDVGKGCIRFTSFADLPRTAARQVLRDAARMARAPSVDA